MGKAQNYHVVGGVLTTTDGTDIIRGGLNLTGNYDLISIKGVSLIRGDASFADCTNLKSLGSLTTVYGTVELTGCVGLEDLGLLRLVRGSLRLLGTQVDSIPETILVRKGVVGKDGFPVHRDFPLEPAGQVTKPSLSLA